MVCKYCGAGLHSFHCNEETAVCAGCWDVLSKAEVIARHPRLLAALTKRIPGMLTQEKAAAWALCAGYCETTEELTRLRTTKEE